MEATAISSAILDAELNADAETETRAPQDTRLVQPEAVIRSEAQRSLPVSALLSQVKNTIPFAFAADADLHHGPGREYLVCLREADLREAEGGGADLLSHVDYFRLCLSAHWATVGSFAPMDLDAVLRFKLWHPSLPAPTLEAMARVALEAYRWDESALSRRWVQSPNSAHRISAHQGEWLAVAVAAYAVTRHRAPAVAAELLEAIRFELTREASTYLEMKRARDGVALLKGATLVAHNLGDFDRAVEAWGLDADDPLAAFAYPASRGGAEQIRRFSGAFAEAGRLNRDYMAAENHRHFALRAPRCLRRSETLLAPVAPFFDEWGSVLARNAALRPVEIAETVAALVQGWERLKGPEALAITHGYPRAVAGILDALPGGLSDLAGLLPASAERHLKSGLFHSLVSVPRARFEEQWAQKALKLAP